MSEQADLHLAYILHTRPYRETSLLVDIMSREWGRKRLVAKGVRRAKSKQVLHLYQPYLIKWSGKGDLLNLQQAELVGPYSPLAGKASLCGLYVNELLVKLMPEQIAEPDIFDLYQHTLQQLLDAQHSEITLRLFEKHLLQHLGYGLQLQFEVHSHELIKDDIRYLYHPDRGPEQVHVVRPDLIYGKSLRQLDYEAGFDEQGLKELKVLMRSVINYHLGHQVLQSRRLFAEMNHYQ
jgi:DNA repair protein RecO (recombination protein O)